MRKLSLKKLVPFQTTLAWLQIQLRRYHRGSITPWHTYVPLTLLCLTLLPKSSAKLDAHLLMAPQTARPIESTVVSSSRNSANAWDRFKPAWNEGPSDTLMAAAFKLNPFAAIGRDADDLVADPSGLLERDFRIPDYLKARVAFWIRVYSQYNSQVRIVHDRHRMDLVYGIIDLRPLHRQYGNSAEFEIRAASIEKKILRHLKDIIVEATSDRRAATSGDEVAGLRKLLSRFGALNPAEGQRLCNSVRTQTGQRDMFLLALQRSKDLLPHIESVLRQNGLPLTLARIPFVESSFNVHAQSKIGAVGIWQFTPDTAREWIAKTEEHLWSDPIRQTRSAARLLRGYRTMLPDWTTTITSYNSGIGRVRRLTQKHRSVNIEPLISARENNGLGFAGKNFYAEVMAATLVEAYKDQLFGVHLLPDSDSDVALLPAPSIDRCER